MNKESVIGSMNSRIQFQSSTTITTSTFEKQYTWNTDFTIWGKIKQTSGMMFTRGDSNEPIITHVITIRRRSDVDRNMRLLNNGNEYTIHKINPTDEGNLRFLQLFVEQKDEQA